MDIPVPSSPLSSRLQRETSAINSSLDAGDTPAPAGASAGGEAALRLDKRTLLDKRGKFFQGHYRIILRNYGQGLGEIGWSFVHYKHPPKVGRGLSDQREMHEDRAVRRARSRLRQLILTTGADHLLTLTYRENMVDFDLASSHLSKFVRLIKNKQPGWIYVAVAEQQERGAWHWHLAVCGRQDVDMLRASWRHVVGEGNIDVKAPKSGVKNRQLALVKYLGKYLAKGFKEGNRELNARRFRASRGIEVPAQYVILPKAHYANVRTYVEGRLVEATGSLGFSWAATGKPAGWACSWK